MGQYKNEYILHYGKIGIVIMSYNITVLTI